MHAWVLIAWPRPHGAAAMVPRALLMQPWLSSLNFQVHLRQVSAALDAHVRALEGQEAKVRRHTAIPPALRALCAHSCTADESDRHSRQQSVGKG